MMIADALDLSYATGLDVARDVALGPYTSPKIGGPADYFVRARSAPELARSLDMAHLVERVDAWFPAGRVALKASDLGYAYRASRFKRHPEPAAILAVELRL